MLVCSMLIAREPNFQARKIYSIYFYISMSPRLSDKRNGEFNERN